MHDRPRALAERSLIDVGLVLLFIVLPHSLSGDAYVRFQALSELIEQGKISNMTFAFAGPLCSAPLYFLGKLLFAPAWWIARFNVIVLAVGLIAADRIMRDDVDRGLIRKFFLVLLAASMFPNHLRGYYGEVFTAVLVGVGILALRFGRTVAGWSAIVLGVVNTPATTVGLALIVAKQVWETRRWRHVVPMVVAVAAILFEAWFRRGGPFVTGYEGWGGAPTVMPYAGRPGFSYPFLFGVLSILLSFGKGLVFFAPGLLLAANARAALASERLRGAFDLWLLFLIGLILVYSKWWAWYGGWFWGPRFFLFASIPASLAIAVHVNEPRGRSLGMLLGVFGALTLSAWVGLNGAVFDQRDLELCVQNSYALEFLCWYTPEFTVLWHPFVSCLSVPADQIVLVAYVVAAYAWLAAPVVPEIAKTAVSTTSVRQA